MREINLWILFYFIVLPILISLIICILGVTVFKNSDTPGKRFLRKLKKRGLL